MSTVPELIVIGAIEAAAGKNKLPSIDPLVRHLRTAETISGDFSRYLAELIDPAGKSPYRLSYGRRDQRRMISDEVAQRQDKAFQRVQELTGALASATTCKDIISQLPGWSSKLSRTDAAFATSHSVVAFRLKLGRPISQRMATLIAAHQHNLSFSTLKRVVLDTEKALRQT